jgi:hypothetical protein
MHIVLVEARYLVLLICQIIFEVETLSSYELKANQVMQ